MPNKEILTFQYFITKKIKIVPNRSRNHFSRKQDEWENH